MTVTNPYSKFIPGEEIRDFLSWRFDDVGEKARRQVVVEPVPVPPTSEELALAEKYRQQGFAEGFIQGAAQTKLEAQREVSDYISQQGQTSAEQITRMVQSLQTQLTQLEQDAAEHVLLLACELARQIVRKEVQSTAQTLLPAVQEALTELMAEHKPKRLRVHPADVPHLQEPLGEMWAESSLSLVQDAALSPGSFVLESGPSVVDGTLEGRWQRAIASLGLNLPWEEAPHAP